jgi:hypothetical protein
MDIAYWRDWIVENSGAFMPAMLYMGGDRFQFE